jgi:uncharacterized protein (TIGR00369 family)
MDPTALRQVIEELIPFNKFLGIRAERIEPGRALLQLPFRDELIGDFMKRAVHGGVISTLVDVAAGMAVWSALEDPVARISTVDLRVDYLRPGKPHTLLAEAEVVRLGGRIAVADVKVFHPGNEAEPISTGKGVYVIRIPKHASRDAG